MSYDFDGSKIEPNKKRILNAFGLALRGEAATRAPVDTGALRNSINYKVEDDSVTVGSQLNYALIQEKRKGFLSAALDVVGAQSSSIIKANA